MRTFRLFLGLFLGALLIGGTALAQPMSGTFTIGDSDPDADDYASIAAAVSDLMTRGLEGPVTFEVEELVYIGNVEVDGDAITGQGIENPVTFRDAVPGGTRPLIKGAAAASAAVLWLWHVSYFTFDGIDVQDTIAGYPVRVQGISWYNTIKNCTITGFSETSMSTVGLYHYGGQSWDPYPNGETLIDNVTFTQCYYNIYINGVYSQPELNVEVRNCTFTGGQRGVWVNYADSLRIHDNDIQPGWANNTTQEAIGIYIGSHYATYTIFIYNNKIHNIRSVRNTLGNARGIQVSTSPQVGSFVWIYNNMIYDFETGTSSAKSYAIEASGGSVGLYYNSIYLDSTGTGEKNGVRIAGSNASVTMNNNIVVMGETDATQTFGVYRSQGTLVASDNNCFFNLGGGTTYRMGYYGGNRVTLADWQAYWQASGFDVNSVDADPGYISTVDPHNLHINADNGLVHLRGVPIDGITDDIDGDARWTMPDMGADEYTYNAPTEDYWVRWLLGWTWLNPELTALTTDAIVVNRGSANQTAVPVVFFYDGLPQDTVSVTLNAYTFDTVTFNWTTPAAPDTILLEAQSFLTGDAVLDNDSVTASVRIIGLPMAGTYTIGATRSDYATFGAAVADVILRGVSGAVTFDVDPNTYSEAVAVTAIPGASADNTITFHPAPAHLDTPPEIVSGTSPAVNLNGADYVTFDDIDITCTLAASKAVQMTGSADYNVIKNCTLTGTGEDVANNYGVHITGGGNDYNLIDNVSVNHTLYYPVYLAGASGTRDLGNEVRNCTLIGGRYGMTLNYQNGAAVHDCDIQPGYDASTAEVIGIYVAAQTAGELSTAYANRIHNIRGAGATNGIYAAPGVGCLFKAYNNFVYDYVVTGTGVVYGLRVGNGTPEFYNNSVYIGDVGTTGAVYGFYQTTTTTVTYLKNNVLQVDEPDNACWAVYRNQGAMQSNYNAFFSAGPGAAYNMGFAGASYASLWLWNRALGYDANSAEGDPGFMNATDLHIQPHYSLLNGVGLDTAGITTDIDGDGRGSPPDIGADEYTFTSMADDYGVIWVDTQYVFIGTVPRVIRAVVKNYGSSAETDVPVVLFYNDVAQDTVLKSLASGAMDTVDLDWTPSNPVPPADQEIGTLVIKAFCPSDTFAYNDSLDHPVSVRGAPLSGEYDLGGGAMDYATFNAAVTSLTLRGMDSEVIFNVYAGTYTENVIIGPIAGANYTDRIIFRNFDNNVVTIAPTTILPLRITGGDYITFDGINIQSGVGIDTLVTVRGDADYVTLKNMTLTGNSNSFACCGVKVFHDGNDNFLADNLSVSTVFYGISDWNTGSGSLQNWEVRNCHITNTSYCIMYDGAYNARVHNNDIEPSGGYGVYVSTVPSGDTTWVYNNRIHNLNNSSGIFATVGSNGCAYFYNNFMWDWHATGTTAIAALMPSVGTTHWYFNTVYMDDQPSEADGGKKSFYYRSTGTAYVMNNIFVSAEDADTVNCYDGITGLTADYNCFYDATGANPNFQMSPGYATLVDWQVTGNDLNSIVGNPGLVSTTDLHIDSLFTLVDSAGTPIAEVSDDIDGDPRDAAFPDMGADEYVAIYPPDPVTDLTVIRDSMTNDVILQWSATTGAVSYKIYAGTTPDFEIGPLSLIGTTGGLSFTHSGIVATQDLQFYVVLASTDAPPAVSQPAPARGRESR